MKILVTGGCGFVGTVLTEKLLADGHEVIVVDSQWFGSYLVANSRLTVVKMDIRDTDALPLTEVEAIVHLANIANDPAVELNPELSWEVNVLAGQQLADFAVRAGVRHFIYASSGSVYGVQEEEQVTEDLALVPISAYNKTKMVAERVFLSYQEDMRVHCIRPATVCGVSPRMRLDVSVNMFTHQALSTGRITVFGGDQTRPNIHIDDMVQLILFLIRNQDISGAVNATAPHPVSNKQFSQSLGKALSRPAFMPMPAAVLNVLMGEMADLLTTGQFVVPKKALENNYRFHFSEIDAALKSLV